jgi:hypothetical protein
MYWLCLEKKQAPEGRNSKNTCSSRSSRSNPEKSCPKSFPNKPGVVCPHDEFLGPQAKICLWERKHVGVRRVFFQSEYFPYSTHYMLFFPTPVKLAPNACP